MVKTRQLSIVLMAACCNAAMADGGLDAFRELDLNKFALGASFFTSASPYAGIGRFRRRVPGTHVFREMRSTRMRLFFVRDGDIGLRALFNNGWDIGAVVSVQTLGYGSGQSPALAGMSRRDWTIQGGAALGRHVGDYRFDLRRADRLAG